MERQEAEQYAVRLDEVLTTAFRKKKRFFVQRGIPPSQFLLLKFLRSEAPQKVSDLAEALHVSCPAVSNLLSELAKSGYISRYEDPADRRVTLIDLTTEGCRIIKQEEQWRHLWVTQVLEQFNTADIDTFLRVYSKLLDEKPEQHALCDIWKTTKGESLQG